MSENNITLVRGLGLVAAISIIIGNVIGTGVFLKARVMTCNLGSPEWVLLAWVAAGLLSLAGALTYAELSAMKPEAGGEYVFLRDAYGRVSSFLYGWMQIFIAKTGSQAAVAVAFTIGLNDFLGGGLKQVLYQNKFHPLSWLPNNIAFFDLTKIWNLIGLSSEYEFSYELTSLQLIAVMIIIIFTTINCASVVLSGQIATFLTFVKIFLIIFVALGAFLFVTGGNFGNFSMMNTGGTCEGVSAGVRYGSDSFSYIAGFSAAMLGALWGYDGWNNLSLVAGEVKKSGKNKKLLFSVGHDDFINLYFFR